MSELAMTAIVQAGLSTMIYVSVATAWEIGMLSASKPAGGAVLQFLPDAKTWFTRFAAGPGIRISPITPEIAVDASYLPGAFHRDPGDRLIVSTARHIGATIVTRDQKILAYADAGYVQGMSC